MNNKNSFIKQKKKQKKKIMAKRSRQSNQDKKMLNDRIIAKFFN